MNKQLTRFSALAFLATVVLSGVCASCNSKEETHETITVTVSTVAVKNFALQADKEVLSHLDSVFFSIDLDRAVIYNADSLPLGTKTDRLIPVITFSNSMSEAKLIMDTGKEVPDTVDYLTNPTDSVDFSRSVKLAVKSWDGAKSYTYDIKLNVHKQRPDSLMWDHVAVAQLPSLRPDPVRQGTAVFNGNVYSCIKEADGSFTWSSTDNLFDGTWTRRAAALPFVPQPETLTATPSALYMLADDGSLYTSADAAGWTDTGCDWLQIVGPYMDCVLGIAADGARNMHVHWPADAAVSDSELEPGFPLYGRSQLISFDSRWAQTPTAVTVGGIKADGTVSQATWAFDGTVWAEVDNKPAPAIQGASMFRYTSYAGTTDFTAGRPYDTLYLLGGTLADGNPNRAVYISRDNGVTWMPGGTLTDLPEAFPTLNGAGAVVESASLSADLTDAWTAQPAALPGRWLKPAYTLDGYDISWQCPYIYIIGGTLPSGSLSPSIWRGVMARLAFTPLI